MKLREYGRGKPLLMIHGLGGRRRSWDTIVEPLAARRRLMLFDLPGHGAEPAEPDSGTWAGLVRSMTELIADNSLRGVDVVGSSLGARLALELARRGLVGNAVALDPGGFWQGWERAYLRNTLTASVWLLRSVRAAIPALAHNAVSRSALLAQLSAKPWALDGDVVERELKSFADCRTFDPLVRDLAAGPMQEGPSASGSGRVTIVWGKQDRLCLPQQAERAKAAFPEAELVWFDGCGHFPMWDRPKDTVELVLRATA